mgnify:CR=1 FL=1
MVFSIYFFITFSYKIDGNSCRKHSKNNKFRKFRMKITISQHADDATTLVAETQSQDYVMK